MPEPMTAEKLAEITARVDGLDRDRTFNGGVWKCSPVDSKSVLPPQTNFVVEDVLKTGDCIIRASVAVFADESLAEFTAHAREDVPALLARIAELSRYAGALEAAICQCEPERDGSDYLHAADCAVVPIQMQVFGYPAPEAVSK